MNRKHKGGSRNTSDTLDDEQEHQETRRRTYLSTRRSDSSDHSQQSQEGRDSTKYKSQRRPRRVVSCRESDQREGRPKDGRKPPVRPREDGPKDAKAPRQRARDDRPKDAKEPRQRSREDRPKDAKEPRQRSREDRSKDPKEPRQRSREDRPKDPKEPRQRSREDRPKDPKEPRQRSREDRPKDPKEPRQRSREDRPKDPKEPRQRSREDRPKDEKEPRQRSREDRLKDAKEPRQRPREDRLKTRQSRRNSSGTRRSSVQSDSSPKANQRRRSRERSDISSSSRAPWPHRSLEWLDITSEEPPPEEEDEQLKPSSFNDSPWECEQQHQRSEGSYQRGRGSATERRRSTATEILPECTENRQRKSSYVATTRDRVGGAPRVPREPREQRILSRGLCGQLERALRNREVTCLICLDPIVREVRIWFCRSCWCICCLSCVNEYIRVSLSYDRYMKQFPCPQCAEPHILSQMRMVTFSCWCGDCPDFERVLRSPMAFSCWKLCLRSLSDENNPQCTHTCPLHCHPGPCPPCSQYVVKPCEACGRNRGRVPCSAKPFLCSKQCEQRINPLLQTDQPPTTSTTDGPSPSQHLRVPSALPETANSKATRPLSLALPNDSSSPLYPLSVPVVSRTLMSQPSQLPARGYKPTGDSPNSAEPAQQTEATVSSVGSDTRIMRPPPEYGGRVQHRQALRFSRELPGEWQDLENSLIGGEVTCRLCFFDIVKDRPIWFCKYCWSIFCLSCMNARIDKKLDDNRTQMGGDTSHFQCPSCSRDHQIPLNSRHLEFQCWCGTVRGDMTPTIPGNIPFSCGKKCENVMNWRRINSCSHGCPLVCHPGRCPPCTRFVWKSCLCGGVTLEMPCPSSFKCNKFCTAKDASI